MTDKTEHVPGELTQAEKLAALQNDQRVAREKGTTLHQFAQSEADTPRGRFAAQESQTVTGATPLPVYPAAYLNHDPVPDEPSLGTDINKVEPDR